MANKVAHKIYAIIFNKKYGVLKLILEIIQVLGNIL